MSLCLCLCLCLEAAAKLTRSTAPCGVQIVPIPPWEILESYFDAGADLDSCLVGPVAEATACAFFDFSVSFVRFHTSNVLDGYRHCFAAACNHLRLCPFHATG